LQIIHLKCIFYSLVVTVGESNKLVMAEPAGTAQQKWYFDEDFTIRNERGLVLDVAPKSKELGTPIIACRKHGEPNQKFRIVPASKVE
jgi:hypothetical protein